MVVPNVSEQIKIVDGKDSSTEPSGSSVVKRYGKRIAYELIERVKYPADGIQRLSLWVTWPCLFEQAANFSAVDLMTHPDIQVTLHIVSRQTRIDDVTLRSSIKVPDRKRFLGQYWRRLDAALEVEETKVRGTLFSDAQGGYRH